jgi:hypothetical protein
MGGVARDVQLSAEDQARVRSGLAAVGEPHKVEGGRVLVQGSANKAALLAQLEQMDKMPSDTSPGFAQMVKDANPWLPQDGCCGSSAAFRGRTFS